MVHVVSVSVNRHGDLLSACCLSVCLCDTTVTTASALRTSFILHGSICAAVWVSHKCARSSGVNPSLA